MATKKKLLSWPGIVEARRFAELSLAQPPCMHLCSLSTVTAERKVRLHELASFIQRAQPVGDLVGRFVLPLDHCPTMDVLMRKHGFRLKARMHDKVFAMLIGQAGFRKLDTPLEGRPLVRFVRFSVQARQDRDASWTKVPLDVLGPSRLHKRGKLSKVAKQGMGFIKDDNQQAIDLQAWWEPGDQRHQFVYIDIWTGRIR